MRERGMSTVAAVFLAALAGLATATLMMDWVVVDVETRGPEAVHVVVPCPLLLPELAANFIPDDAMAEATVPPEARQYRDNVIEAVRALVEAPDATLVRVDAPDAQVEIVKDGDDLRVVVDADDAKVRCTVPIDGVLEALEDWDWQTFEPELIFDVLHAAGNGNMVLVEAEEATVRVALW
jgi:hypothetical protein